jgi:6-phosphogluconolactonase
MSQLHVFTTKSRAAAGAARFILDQLTAALEGSRQVSLAVSGGSTPKLMFEEMAQDEFKWSRLQLFFVDERPVGPEHPDSNFAMTNAALCQPVGLENKQVHRIHGELEPSDAAEKYMADLTETFQLEDGEAPRFDVLHLGMGDDAHTASLFPGEPLICDRLGVATSVYSTSKKSYRVSLLPKALLNAAATVFLVTGEDKAAPLKAVLEGPEDFLAFPAQLVERRGHNVHWFIDEAAAAELDR